MQLGRCALLVCTCLPFFLACAPVSAPRPGAQPPGASPAGTTAPPAVDPGGTLAAPPSRGAFETGAYRDLFAERGHPPAEVKARIDAAYEQLFHGRPEDQAVFFAAGKNAGGELAYVMDVGNGDVRSEGMSYGMMIAVQMDRQRDFDALWNWAKTYMVHADPAHPCHGYFSWQMKPTGEPIDENPAADGEEYFATALFFAAHRWGGRAGIYDYAAEARRLVSDMKNRPIKTGKTRKGKQETIAALFNPEQKMVRFTPDTGNFGPNGDHTDPSYHLPHFYELWARWGKPQDRQFWVDAARTSRDFFVRVAHPVTGLTPDYATFDGKPKAATWDAKTATFRWDAWRTAMNWAVDHAWFAADPRERELSDRIQAFFEAQGLESYGNNFTLDGQPTSKDHSPGLVAMNAVASLAATQPRAARFVDALWSAPVPTGKWRYYDGMLQMMALLHVSGRFRVHAPTSAGANPAG